jgi:hypothetical protein
VCPIEACPARRMSPVRITREAEKMIMIGADSHKRTHSVVALDEVGRKVGQKTVSTDSEGHLQLLRVGPAVQGARVRVGGLPSFDPTPRR